MLPKTRVVESEASILEEASQSTEQQESDDSCDQVPVRQPSTFVSHRREILNKPATAKDAPLLPGITNIKQ